MLSDVHAFYVDGDMLKRHACGADRAAELHVVVGVASERFFPTLDADGGLSLDGNETVILRRLRRNISALGWLNSAQVELLSAWIHVRVQGQNTITPRRPKRQISRVRGMVIFAINMQHMGNTLVVEAVDEIGKLPVRSEIRNDEFIVCVHRFEHSRDALFRVMSSAKTHRHQ